MSNDQVVALKRQIYESRQRELHFQKRFKSLESTVSDLKHILANNGQNDILSEWLECKKNESELVKRLREENRKLKEGVDRDDNGDDMKRVVARLSEVQEESTTLRDRLMSVERSNERMMKTHGQQVTELNEIIVELRGKLEKSTKQQQPSKVDINVQNKVMELSEAYSSILSENNVLKARLEKESAKLQHESSELETLREQERLQSYALVETQRKLEEATMRHQSELTRVRTDFDDERERMREELASNERRRVEAEQNHKRIQSRYEELKSQVESAQAGKAELKTTIDELSKKLDTANAQLGDVEVERSIESKKRNQLVKQLRSELQQLSRNNVELDGILKSKSLELEEARGALAVAVERAERATIERVTSSNALSKSTSSRSVEEVEVSEALAIRLSQSEDENFKLKQKLSFVESNVQLLTDDLERKRMLMNHYVQRMGPGALTTSDVLTDIERKRKMSGKQSEKMRAELYDKMELILHETVLENQHLRQDKLELGNELKRLHQRMTELEEKPPQQHDQ